MWFHVTLKIHLIMKSILITFYHIIKKHSNKPLLWDPKSLILLLKIIIPLDTQFWSNQTLSSSTYLPHHNHARYFVLLSWLMESPLMRHFLHWMQIWDWNENKCKYVERQILHFINTFLKSWLKIVMLVCYYSHTKRHFLGFSFPLSFCKGNTF